MNIEFTQEEVDALSGILLAYHFQSALLKGKDPLIDEYAEWCGKLRKKIAPYVSEDDE